MRTRSSYYAGASVFSDYCDKSRVQQFISSAFLDLYINPPNLV